MARLTQVPRRSASNPISHTSDLDSSLTDLNRLLARLRETVLHADAERERRLRTSEYERNKAGINLEYARTLLTKLEQDALAIKIHTRRQELQADLARKHDIFEQLTERLCELEDLSVGSDEDDSSEGEDLVGGVVHTPSGSPDSRPADPGHVPPEDDRGGDGTEEEEADESTVLPERSTRFEPARRPSGVDPSAAVATTTATTQTAQVPASTTTQPAEPQATETAAAAETTTTTTTTSQTLRPRGAATTTPAPDTGATTARQQRDKLFGDRTPNSATTATTEAILDHQRAEQDALTESLVKMAASLKQSSRAFATSLEGEKAVLGAAGQGLARNETGLEAAARRMGALRRFTEGRGWWGRMMLYAWIFALMVVAVLIVFVLPKLRF